MTLERSGFVALPRGHKRGFDHADAWLGARAQGVRRAHGADRVDVIDCESRSFLRSIDDLLGVAGVLVDQEHDLLFTSDRASARVSVFRCSDEALLGRVAVGAHPNGLAFDPSRQAPLQLQPGGATRRGLHRLGRQRRVDACRGGDRPPRTAEVGGTRRGERSRVRQHPRSGFDLRIDPARAAIVGSIDVPVAGPHGLWIAGGRLYCAADGESLVVLDRDSGAVETSLPLPGVPDVVWFDAVGGRLFVAVGDPGTVTVVDTLSLVAAETFETEPGAHTLTWERTARPCTCSAPKAAALPSTAEQ